MYFTFLKNKLKFSEIKAVYAHAPGAPETNRISENIAIEGNEN